MHLIFFVQKQKKKRKIGKSKKEAKRNYKDFFEGVDLKTLAYESLRLVQNPGNIKRAQKNKAREVAIYIARDITGITCKDLGEYFGGVSGALITMMHKRIAEESKRNKQLKGRIDNIRI